MRNRFFFILLMGFLFSCVNCYSQSVSDAAKEYNRFVQYYTNGQKSAAFPALYTACDTYLKVLDNVSLSAQHPQVKETLKEAHTFLEEAAYYYTEQSNQHQTLLMSQIYVTIAVHPAMQDVALKRTGINYSQIVMLAAFNTYNAKEYAKCIPFLIEYINTGDGKMREQAFEGLGKAYYYSKEYQQAITTISQGLQLYPNNKAMLLTMINACGKTEDDTNLQRHLPQAILLFQGDSKNLPVLLNTLGMSYERTDHFELAVDTYEQLLHIMPNDLNTTRHLALDYYNAGVQNITLSNQAISKKESKRYKEQAAVFFRKAEPMLNQVMRDDPFQVAKYALALANSYSFLEEKVKLEALNTKIVSLGYSPVSEGGGNTQLIGMNDVAPKPNMRPVAPTPQPVAQQTPTPQPVQANPQPAPQTAKPDDIDVDVDIAQTHFNNNRTFAVIIANENYSNVAPVPMAANDGKIFAEYCRKVLGMPATNVREHYDLTSLGVEDALDDIKQIARACKGNLDVIFYYAGHGVPDDATKDAFMLPVDGRAGRTTGCKSLKELYTDLESLEANCVTVFLDACFSGAARGGGMVASARGVGIKPKPAEAAGNMIVFSAVSDAETALPYKEKKHGLFTYYLLKKLRESKGDVTLGELSDYLSEQVALQAQLVNRKSQTPTVRPSLALGDRWRSFKLTK